MNLAIVVALIVAVGIVGFFALSLAKAWKLAHMKMHARLDLYPVPKEGAGRARYGGSYLEQSEWWNKPREIDHFNETREILKEMIFIKKLFVNQRSLWWASYAMHLGIYVMFCWSILLFITAFLSNTILVAITQVVGVVGFGLCIIGCISLFIRRFCDPILRRYTTPLEYGNIGLLLVVLVTGGISWLFLASPFSVAQSLVHLSPFAYSPLVVIHLILLTCMFIYIPLSKMSHYVAKFFTYHRVLWDNDPNVAHSEVERRFKDNAAHPSASQWSSSCVEDGAAQSAKG